MERGYKVFSLLFFIAVAHAQCVLNEATTRLPQFIVPTAYSLYYTFPSPDTPSIVSSNSASFSGNVSIDIQIYETTTCIAIHSYLLQLSPASITLSLDDGGQLSPSSIQRIEVAQINILQFSQPITPQLAQLTIPFSGNFNNQSATGFFLSDNDFDPSVLELENKVAAFKRRNEPKINKTKKQLQLTAGKLKMYATQFEATAARYAYPSFDEPEFKATFKLTATVTYSGSTPSNSIVLFNSPLASSFSGSGYTTFTFEPTKNVMSTYLVAIAVGQFDYVETTNSNDVVFRIYTPPGASQYATFALNVTKNVVSYFSESWKFNYNLMNSKMDQIAVPAIDEDAMENWGLLTYWPEFLLVDSENPKTPLPSLQIVSLVVVHEIAHQWFGDTVTMPWWNQIFLNEGYARYLQYIGTDYLFPDWEIFTQGGDNSYYNFAYLPALQADFMGLAPPVVNLSQISGIPSEATADFGIIPYGKGASLNRMIATYLTETRWNQIMAAHLMKYKFSNPSILNLMQSYDAVVPNFSQKIYPYFIYPGFPVLNIQVNNSSIELSQSPISTFGNYNPNPYWISTKLQAKNTQTGVQEEFSVDFQTTTTTLDLPNGMWAVIADVNFSSYALINYDSWTWNQIISQITEIPDVNRQLIVQSQFMLMQMAFLGPQIPSATAYALSSDFESIDLAYPLYQSIFDNWYTLIGLYRNNSSVYSQIVYDLNNALSAILKRVGYDSSPSDDASTRALRSLALFYGAFFGAIDVIKSEQELFQKGNLQPEQQKGVYWAVVRYYPDGYDQILQLYKNSTSADEKSLLLFALLAPPNNTLCQTTITSLIMVSSTPIITQLNLLSQMMWNNFECRGIAWEAFQLVAQKTGWPQSGSALTPYVIKGFDGLFSDLSIVKPFIAKNQQYFTPGQINTIFTHIQINAQVVAKFG